MSFEGQVKEHLVWYKEKVLKLTEEGQFKKKSYKHILPKEKIKFNYLSRYRKAIKKYIDKEQISLHTYANHLNSSQVMGFNFFYPLCKTNQMNVFTDFLNLPMDKYHYQFEKVLSDQTNVDFYLESDELTILTEIKYTEHSGNYLYQYRQNKQKYLTIYENSLVHHYFNNVTVTEFYQYYQLFRNFLHALRLPSGMFVFLYPKENKEVDETFEGFMKLIKSKIKKLEQLLKIRNVYWETLLSYTLATVETRLLKHYQEFKYKYFDFYDYRANVDMPIYYEQFILGCGDDILNK